MFDNFDIKVGYTCNNNCLHCVVKPNVMEMNSRGEKLDLNTEEIMAILSLACEKGVKTITLTGGEITIRPDFKEIILGLKKILGEKAEHTRINMQTNGRYLAEHLDFLKDTGLDFFYVVALHSSNAEIHNKIVGNTDEHENPYQQTMNAIRKITELYGSFNDTARIEIVLSTYNLQNLVQTIKDLRDIGVMEIGISYPHLCGFDRIFDMKYVLSSGTGYPHFLTENMKIGETLVNKIGFDYAQIRGMMPELHKLALEEPDLYLRFEEIPMCVWRDSNGKLLKPLRNLWFMGNQLNDETAVTTPNGFTTEDFRSVFIKDHKKPKLCRFCELTDECAGLWAESVNAFGDKGITPISQEEIEELIRKLKEEND